MIVTVLLAFFTVVIGFILGITLAIIRMSDFRPFRFLGVDKDGHLRGNGILLAISKFNPLSFLATCYVEVIRSTYDLLDDNCENLKYCEDVRFMDIGHNEWLDAVSFVAYMPKLEGIIVSGAPIKDLTPFENCKNLKFLEIAFCEYIEDLTPLAGCESLQMLNMSNTHALDLSPLDDLPLTHLVARTNPSGNSRISQEEQDRFIAQHPDCWSSFKGAQPYGVGWRYGEDELTPLPYYAMLRRVFRYDASVIPNNVGWYLEEGITDLDYKET